MENCDRLKGGLYGLLIGDALGVPYEFHSADQIPPYDKIEMIPPQGFRRTYTGVAPGTWSDDGAQALCLLDSLMTCGSFQLKDFSDRLLSWYQEGLWAVDGKVFDIGIQTSMALDAYRRGKTPEECGMIRPDGKGNGALMRVLPLALWHTGTEHELVLDAHAQCVITHGNPCNQVCCALYCLVARFLLKGAAVQPAVEKAVFVLREIYEEMPVYAQELEWSVRPQEPWIGQGSGYVVDCLRSALMILLRAESYEEAVKQAVQLGGDTDTTACVTGGLAGVLFGFDAIPKRWYEALRGKEDVKRYFNE
jgi:ADP-ribosylglycohydrolase